MTSHTPGPWVLSKQSPKIIMQGHAPLDVDGPMIGSVTGNDDSGFYVSEAEAAANAHLFAAAPELLVALENLAREVTEYFGEEGFTLPEARAAIAKAKGETPHG